MGNLCAISRNPFTTVTRLGAMALTVPVGATLVMAGALGARAQVEPLDPLGTTTTTAPPASSTTTTTAAPVLANPLDPKPVPKPAPAPPPPAARPAPPPPAVPVPTNGSGEGVAPPPDAGPFPEDLARLSRSVKRTRPNSSNALVDALRALTDLGMPLDEAMRVGMGRFPVAGRATYSHDWWYPRFGPGWRLHQGTDLFGARGTPLRSPANGVVRFGNGGLGGISTYVVQSDGTYFYFAHLEGRPKDLKDGQAVGVGDIVGILGSSGNASGGSPHLHFEVHPAVRVVTVGKGKKRTTKVVHRPVRPGTVLPAMDPKPLLDLYLEEAMDQLPAIVEAYKASRPPAAVTPEGAAVPTGAVAVPGQELAAAASLVPAEPPLIRGPLLALAFLLVMMVGVLTPVLAPRRRLLDRPPPAAPPGEKQKRRRRRTPPPPADPPPATEEEGPARRRTRVRGRVRKARSEPDLAA